MPDGPITLGFDTSAAHCAAALVSDGAILASHAEELRKGQAERLFPMLDGILTDAGLTWQQIDRIGCGVGPGNFTGIRIAVAAARGLALGLGRPTVGVSTFDALRHKDPDQTVGVPAPRDQVYVEAPGGEPALVARKDLPAHAIMANDAVRLVEGVALVAAARPADKIAAPKPLYLRPADAAPQRDPPPRILA